jgi:hypothetical protein
MLALKRILLVALISLICISCEILNYAKAIQKETEIKITSEQYYLYNKSFKGFLLKDIKNDEIQIKLIEYDTILNLFYNYKIKNDTLKIKLGNNIKNKFQIGDTVIKEKKSNYLYINKEQINWLKH